MKFSLLATFVLSTIGVAVYAQDGAQCGNHPGQSTLVVSF